MDGIILTAISAADSQYQRSAPPRLTASPFIPKFWAASAAPTVPEWTTDRPTFSPAFIPDTTSSGLLQNASLEARSEHSAGGPETAYTPPSNDLIFLSLKRIGCVAEYEPKEVPVPDAS